MTQIHTHAPDTSTRSRDASQRWPLLATAAGLTGLAATLVLDGRTVGDEGATLDHQLFVDLDPLTFRLSMVLGYMTVVLLLVLAATWRRRVEPLLPDSTAAHLVPLGLVSSAAGLTYGYGWKGALGNYLPGSFEPTAFDDTGLYVYYVLNDFGSFIGWLGVVIAAGAIAVMGLRERAVPRWLGIVSPVLPVLQTTLMVAGHGRARRPRPARTGLAGRDRTRTPPLHQQDQPLVQRPCGYEARVEPIPETLEAVDELDASLDAATLLDQLLAASGRARQIVPGLVGVSVASRDHGITFTVVASSDEIAALDAVQYLSSGPCVDAIDLGHGVATPDGLLNESRWQDFARASAARGVHSTLTLPIVGGEQIVATVNLYGHADDTFNDQHQALAEVFGAWAPGAVTNADLGFSTRAAAERAPLHLRDAATVDTATGIVAAGRNLTVQEARDQLEDASSRAGVPVVELARVVVDLHLGR